MRIKNVAAATQMAGDSGKLCDNVNETAMKNKRICF